MGEIHAILNNGVALNPEGLQVGKLLYEACDLTRILDIVVKQRDLLSALGERDGAQLLDPVPVKIIFCGLIIARLYVL